jgi:hypothetical protein
MILRGVKCSAKSLPGVAFSTTNLSRTGPRSYPGLRDEALD